MKKNPETLPPAYLCQRIDLKPDDNSGSSCNLQETGQSITLDLIACMQSAQLTGRSPSPMAQDQR